MELSIIVPLYNEEESVRPLCEAISSEIGALGLSYEILFVDDGSKDRTFEIALSLARTDRRVRVIKFRRNYGQTPAMAAGIEHANGRILITMDGDLQNDPADIREFVDKINEGYDIVVGWRFNRQDTLLTRKIPSKIANWIIGKVTNIPIKDNGCSLKAYRAEIVKSIPLYSEMHRFIPAMLSLTGAKLMEIKVRHHPRRYGVSKYGLSRIYRVLLDLMVIKTIVSFAQRPLLWFSILAIPAALLSIFLFAISLYGSITNSAAASLPMAGTAFLFGVLVVVLVFAGVVCELVYKTGNINLEKISSLTAETYPRGDDDQDLGNVVN